MRSFLIVVDMQNDFISGTLGTAEAVAIIPAVAKKIKDFDGEVLFTRDTHSDNYANTQEGKNLPVSHCIKDTWGWQIHSELTALGKDAITINKPTFGSAELFELLKRENEKDAIGQITLIGLCTDVCVISNAIGIKAFLPETKITVDSSCCAGVTPKSHKTALEAMRACQIEIL